MENKGFRCGCGLGSVSRGACVPDLGGNNLWWPSCNPDRVDRERRERETKVWDYLQDRHYGWKRMIAFVAVYAVFGLMECLEADSGVQEAWVPIVLAAASVAAPIFGGAKSAAAARKAQREQEAEKAKEDALLRWKRNEAYADTAAGQRLLTQAREFSREQWKKAQGAAKVGGATDAATAIAKEQGNKMMGNTLANMAANDTARQDKADYEQIQSDRRHAQIMSGYEMQRAQAISQAASQASNAMMSAAGSLNSGGALAKNTGNLSPLTEDQRLRMMMGGVQ